MKTNVIVKEIEKTLDGINEIYAIVEAAGAGYINYSRLNEINEKVFYGKTFSKRDNFVLDKIIEKVEALKEAYYTNENEINAAYNNAEKAIFGAEDHFLNKLDEI